MTPGIQESDLAEGECREFEVDGKRLFVVKYDYQLHVYENHCPHLGVELNWQENQFLDPDGVLIQCATHGALFRIQDGKCVSGPCLGQSLKPIAFTIEDGAVIISPART